MTFTYDLTTSIGQIRLEIGDTNNTADQGVKPDGSNFTDAELAYMYAAEGSVLRTAARACEVLARLWANAGQSVRIRDYQIDNRDKAATYQALAAELRQRAGGQFVSGSAPVTRVDGYSADVNSRENEATTGDYGGQVIITRLK